MGGNQRTPRTLLLLLLLFPLCVLAPASPPPVHADQSTPPGTEERLLRAGVPAGLRGRIQASLDRAGEWLAGRMRADGSFADRKDIGSWFLGPDPEGITPLCGLALEHAGRRSAAGRAVRWISPDRVSVRREVLGHAYAAGLALRLLRDHGGSEEALGLLAKNLAESQEPVSGWWAFRWTRPGVPFGLIPGSPALSVVPPPDLVASRFAAEGLAAAAAGGGRAPPARGSRRLDGHAAAPREEGGWSLLHRGEGSEGTLHGISCLVLASDALRRRAALPASMERRLEDALAAGRGALRAEAERFLAFRGRTPRGTAWGNVAVHDLAAACAAAGAEEAGGRDVWTVLAGDLLDAQGEDGSFDGGAPVDDLVATAFAVLVLSRSFDALRPEAPAPVRPAEGAGPEWPEPGALPPRGRIPLEDAEAALALLESSLRDPRVPESSLEKALRLVGRCMNHLGPDGDGALSDEAALVWHRRAEEAFLRVLAGGREDPATGRRTGAGPARIAGLLLAQCHPRVVPGLRSVIEESLLDRRAGDPEPRVLAAAFGALARHGGGESAEGLLKATLSTEGSGARAERCLEALRAMVSFEGLDGGDRRKCAARIVGTFEGLEAAARLQPADEDFVSGAKERWASYRTAVLDALLVLGRDPATGAPARDGRGNLATTVAGFRQWLSGAGEGRRRGR